MNFVKKCDAWLTEQLYQRIVDLTQKQPSWLAAQCSIAAAILACLAYFFGASIIGAGAIVFCVSIDLLVLKGSGYTNGADTAFPKACWFTCIASVSIDMIEEINARRVCQLVCYLCIFSFHYFLCCHPPRPRQRKSLVALKGGA